MKANSAQYASIRSVGSALNRARSAILKISLKAMASAVLRLRHPLVFTVLRRTVAKVLSMGLVVRMCFQCSAGKS